MKKIMKKIIYLIDLTHESKLGLGSDHMPLQLGLIGSYCLKEYGDKVDIQIFKFVDEFMEAVKRQPPFIIAASNYLWNVDLEYKFASAVKEKYPETIVVFGGPNYPNDFDEQVNWLCKYPNIDFYVYRDGEVPFARLVGSLLNNPNINAVKKTKLPSCHALVNGEPFFGELEIRPIDLTIIPSPYTIGLMDKFFEHHLVPSIQTNRGCPFTCTYCVEGEKYYSTIAKMSLERKKADVDYIVDHVKHTKTLRIVDSNFGMYEEDVKFCEYLSKIQEQTGYPDYIACSAGKNQKERILKCNELLRGAIRVTASVQSLVPEVLKNIKRTNISLDDIMVLSDKVSDTDTHAHSEIILALPGDSLKGEEESMSGLVRAGISNITQHQLALLYGAEIASPESRRIWGLKSMFRPIQRCVGIYSFNGKTFPAIDIEEVCVATNALSFEDYLEARRLYLTVGLFYNDRIFGEIHALLRLLHLPSWDWIKLIHNNIINSPLKIRVLYDGFIRDTQNELWETPEVLIKDVSANVDKYASGEAGGNLIYKYRALSIIDCFPELHATAFRYLRDYLADKGISCEDAVKNIEMFSLYQKGNIFDVDFGVDKVFDYDIVKMIKDPLLARSGGILEDIHYPTRIHISHTVQQKESIRERLGFYGSDIHGLTMLMSRFPIKRFYRIAEIIS